MKFRLKEERRFEMSQKDKHVYPYIPNSVPETKAKMMEEIGIKDIEELYEDIPEHLRFKGKLNLPEELSSEYALKRHVESILSKNQSCKDHRCPMPQALQFYIGLKKLKNAETQLILYPREFHGIRKVPHQSDRLRRIVSWFDRHMKK
jgi:hypothetical protein